MRWALVWTLLASAVLLAPLARASGSPHRAGASRQPRPTRQLPPRALQWIAASAVAAACVLAFGIARGGVLTLVLAPGAAFAVGRLAVAGTRLPGRWIRPRNRAGRVAADASLALGLDLVAAALRAGQPLPAALIVAAPAAGDAAPMLARTGGLLRLGAPPDEAWSQVADHPVLAPVARMACRSADSGIRLAAAFEQLAEQVRAARRAAAQARAQRVGVVAMAPLGLCFLPAFVCLGIIPVVVGIAQTVMP